MAAITVDKNARTWNRRAERCVGCGLCAVACGNSRAITMEPVPDCQMPYKSAFSMFMRTTPRRMLGAWRIWRRRW
jgi:Fe-S-cluster-containing hydrogenase component 2